MPEDESKAVTFDELAAEFRESNKDSGVKALKRFGELPDEHKLLMFQQLVDFLNGPSNDYSKSWATSALAQIVTEDSFTSLETFMKEGTKEEREKLTNTRFYGLKSLDVLAIELKITDRLVELCKELEKSGDEAKSPLYASKVLLIKHDPSGVGQDIIDELRDILESSRRKISYEDFLLLTRTLREFSLPLFEPELRDVAANTECSREFRDRSIEALGGLGVEANSETVQTLGTVLTTSSYRNLRLESLEALRKIGNETASMHLIKSVSSDGDAEIRLQAGLLLRELCGLEKAVVQLVYVLMNKETTGDQQATILDVLRHIDKKTLLSSAELNKLIGGADLDKSHLAENMLIKLGGQPSHQFLAQKTTNLKVMSELLSSSEKLVGDKYTEMIEKANFNFTFAFALNIILAMVGVALFFIGIAMVANDESAFGVALGSGGSLSLIVSTYFNDPRKNAKKDLGTLMNASVIYLGFLRQLTHIDTTFKQLYIEKDDFGIPHMQETIKSIQKTIDETVRRIQDSVMESKPLKPPDEPSG